MTPETIEQAADILADRRRRGGVLPEFAAELTPADLPQAYDLQVALMAQLGRRGGWKIGCTTRDGGREVFSVCKLCPPSGGR